VRSRQLSIQFFARRQKARREEPARLEPPPTLLPPPPNTIVGSYRIGVVEYYVYVPENQYPRLRIVEPPPPPKEVLSEILAGIRDPSDPAERYHAEKMRSGYGPLYPLVIDDYVEEIAVDGPGEKVSVIHTLYPGRWMSVDMRLTEKEVDSLAIQIARKAGKMLTIATPVAEGLTEEGHRISVTLSREVSRFGSTIVLRKYPEKPLTISDHVASRIISPLAAAFIWMLLEAQGYVFVIGQMGAGKTTLLQALASLIPPHARIVTIEDTPEIRLDRPYWDSLVTRPRPPGEEINDISLEDLLRFALRRRADYIIVGEVRGRETRLLAQAAASGHGGLTTFHADSPEGAILRLRLDPISLPDLFLNVITSFVLVRRIPMVGGSYIRRVYEISEIVDKKPVTLFKWSPATDRLEPNDPQVIAEKSVRLREAWDRLGRPGDALDVELDYRARIIEEISAMDWPEALARLNKFYIDRYGGPRP